MSPTVTIKIDKFFEDDNVEKIKILIEHIDPFENLLGDCSMFSPVLDSSDHKHLLTYACLLGKINIVKYLTETIMYPDTYNELYIASYKGHIDIIDHLISKGIELEYGCLLYSAMGNQLDLLKYFLSKKIPLKNHEIQECLESPVKNGHIEIVKCLLAHYTEKDLKLYIVMAVQQGNLKMVKILYPFVDDNQDHFLLLKAVQYSQIDIVKFFVAIGTKYTSKKGDAIQLAAYNKNMEILSFLIESTEEPISYDDWEESYYYKEDIIYIKKYLKIRESIYKGPLTEQTETECSICYDRMKIKQGIIQCKECKKCIHKNCQQKWEYKCVYCRTEL